jgi:hydrogenase maturation protease
MMTAAIATAEPAPTVPTGRPLIVGYGNTLRRDDGVGVRAAERLERDPRLAGVAVISVHQLTPELAVDIGAASFVVFIDADVEAEPGAVTVRRVPGSSRTRAGGRPGTTNHHVGPSELLALARELTGASPGAVTVGVGAADLGLGEGLSPSVEAALPAVVARVAEVVGAR